MRNGAIIVNYVFSSTNLASAICDLENLTRQERLSGVIPTVVVDAAVSDLV